MPKPVYVLCAQAVLQEKTSNLVSIFQVLEQITAIIVRKHDDEATATNVHGSRDGFQAIAVWRKENGDAGETFVHEFLVAEQSAGLVPFTFSKEKNLQWFVLNAGGFPIPEKSAMVLVTSRVRRESSNAWCSQSYPIFFDITEKSPEEVFGELPSTQP